MTFRGLDPPGTQVSELSGFPSDGFRVDERQNFCFSPLQQHRWGLSDGAQTPCSPGVFSFSLANSFGLQVTAVKQAHGLKVSLFHLTRSLKRIIQKWNFPLSGPGPEVNILLLPGSFSLAPQRDWAALPACVFGGLSPHFLGIPVFQGRSPVVTEELWGSDLIPHLRLPRLLPPSCCHVALKHTSCPLGMFWPR